MCCTLTINDTRVVNCTRATHIEVKPRNNDTRVVIPLRHRIISALGSNNDTRVVIPPKAVCEQTRHGITTRVSLFTLHRTLVAPMFYPRITTRVSLFVYVLLLSSFTFRCVIGVWAPSFSLHTPGNLVKGSYKVTRVHLGEGAFVVHHPLSLFCSVWS